MAKQPHSLIQVVKISIWSTHGRVRGRGRFEDICFEAGGCSGLPGEPIHCKESAPALAGLDESRLLDLSSPDAAHPAVRRADGGPADAGDQPGLAHLGGQIGAAPSRDGQSEGGGQLTGQGFNLDHYLWGEKTGGDPAESSPPDPSGVFRKSAFARNIPPLDGYPNVSRSHHYANPGLPGESSWLAVPENTVTYIFGHEPIAGDRTILYGLCRGTVELLSGYHNAKSA